MFGQQVINVIFLCFNVHLLTSEVWYCPFSPESIDAAKWWIMSDNHLATLFFFTIIFQQHTAAWVFSFGSHYRQPIWRNYRTNVVGLPDIPMPFSFRFKYFGVLLGGVFASISFQHLVVLGPVRRYFRKKYHIETIPMRK
eukprot:jgi/Phyca11/107409/e_gw1.13.435.1